MPRSKFAPKKKKPCSICGKLFLPANPRNHICSDSCRDIHYQSLGITKVYRNGRYVYRGYNQKGENNNNFKRGVHTKENNYQSKIKGKCERCGSKKNLLVHHKDENRENYKEDNLETLCAKCHLAHHHPYRDKLGRFISSKGIV